MHMSQCDSLITETQEKEKQKDVYGRVGDDSDKPQQRGYIFVLHVDDKLNSGAQPCRLQWNSTLQTDCHRELKGDI